MVDEVKVQIGCIPSTDAHRSADVDFREKKEKKKGKNMNLPVSRSCIISSEEQKWSSQKLKFLLKWQKVAAENC